jgi:hypothetical protein
VTDFGVWPIHVKNSSSSSRKTSSRGKHVFILRWGMPDINCFRLKTFFCELTVNSTTWPFSEFDHQKKRTHQLLQELLLVEGNTCSYSDGEYPTLIFRSSESTLNYHVSKEIFRLSENPIGKHPILFCELTINSTTWLFSEFDPSTWRPHQLLQELLLVEGNTCSYSDGEYPTLIFRSSESTLNYPNCLSWIFHQNAFLKKLHN